MVAQSPERRSIRPAAAKAPAKAGGRLPLTVAIFLVGLLIPLFIYVGGLRLSVYRIVLLLLFFPGLYLLLAGRVGRVRLPDICVILICVWSSISFIVVHGLAPMVQTIGILWVETLGAYLVGRCFIRTPEAFHATVRLLFVLGLIVLPFALYELVTGVPVIAKLLGMIGPSVDNAAMERRLGFDRVQGPFSHPIHMGVFFGSLIGVSYYVLGYHLSRAGRTIRAGFVAFLGATSLSSGPLTTLMAQLYFLVWDGALKTVKARWYILSGLGAFGYVFIDVLSNRTPFEVFISYFALNSETAYNRIRIWRWGWRNIFDNPVFGLGFNEWVHQPWMSDSVDMFWIVGGMRHGLPVMVLYLLAFFAVFLSVAYRHNLSKRVQWYRMGYLASMFGLFAVGWTVHFWNAIFAFFMFMLGSGLWILDHQGGAEEDAGRDDDGDAAAGPPSPYTRFRHSPPAGRKGGGRGPIRAGRAGAGGSPRAAPRS